jgi:hypothetical protein
MSNKIRLSSSQRVILRYAGKCASISALGASALFPTVIDGRSVITAAASLWCRKGIRFLVTKKLLKPLGSDTFCITRSGRAFLEGR